MAILALESSSNFCSIALSLEDKILDSHDFAPNQHDEIMLMRLDALLSHAGVKRSDIEAVIYGRGPGSFTGVRISAAVAQAIALAHDLPIYALSSLAALALSAPVGTRVLTLLDARLGEIYWAAYLRHGAGVEELARETVGTVDEIIGWVDSYPACDWMVLGEGSELLRNACRNTRMQYFDSIPRARELLMLPIEGAQNSPETALPIYLRAERPWRKH